MHDLTADRRGQEAVAGLGFLLYCLKRSGHRPEPADAARLEEMLARVGCGRALDFAAGCAEGTAQVNEEMAEEARRALRSELAGLKAAATDLARVPRGARNAGWRTAARRVAATYTRLKQMLEDFEAKARRERGHAADLRQLGADLRPPARTRSSATIAQTGARRTGARSRGAGRPARRGTRTSRGSPDDDEGEPEPGDARPADDLAATRRAVRDALRPERTLWARVRAEAARRTEELRRRG